MKKIELPLGKKKEILAMYQDKTIKVSEILEKYKISNTVLSKLIREEGIEFRLPKATGPRTNIVLPRCPTCNKPITQKDARFCYWCGADVRSKSEKILIKLSELWSLISNNFNTYNERNEAKKLFEEITDFIKNQK